MVKNVKSLKSCLIRFLYWCENYENCNKSELNDLEIERESLTDELNSIIIDEG